MRHETCGLSAVRSAVRKHLHLPFAGNKTNPPRGRLVFSESLSLSCPLVVRSAPCNPQERHTDTTSTAPETFYESRPCKRRRIEQPTAPVQSPPSTRVLRSASSPQNTQKCDCDMVLDDEPENPGATMTAVVCAGCVSRRQIMGVYECRMC